MSNTHNHYHNNSDVDIEKQLNNSEGEDVSTKNASVSRIMTSGENDEYVHIGNQKYYRSELLQAFGGTLMPGLAAPSVHKFANPAPLGLSAFALTTFVLSLINAQAMGLETANVVVGLAIFYGGLIQLLAGMWEMAVENTFGALALSSYGGFWMSFGAINIPWFGISAAYTNTRDLEVALGFYLLGWAIFTFMLMLATMKSTVAFFSLFATLDLTFLLLSVGNLAPSANCTKAGGIVGVITAFVAWYNAYAGLATHENAYVTVKAFPIPVIGGKKKN
ncbi:hypothetical protein PACTADRAFT_47551 [Pachysolen tannophilus NRRL Y-2460]|uniref:Uncharacterized protein n=1 Tax=Pachysolen tannophilus NRRL Y-2460 TaxID=669874 RepID=A0A1E4U112_PACTA|nr:hypothetical protein PACTADRAFT_47551 [Pachysolen tannophilus NRRL Y-2460]